MPGLCRLDCAYRLSHRAETAREGLAGAHGGTQEECVGVECDFDVAAPCLPESSTAVSVRKYGSAHEECLAL